MLKIKDNVNLKELIKYGFKRDSGKSYYFKHFEQGEIFVWTAEDPYYDKRVLYIDSYYATPLLIDFDVLFDLINDGIVEKVI